MGALAGPCEVLVTSTVKDLADGSGLSFTFMREHRLKGIDEPRLLYAAAETARD